MTSTAACTTYSSVSVSTSIVSTTVVTSSFSSTLPYPTTAATAKASQPLNPDNYCPQNFPYYYAWCNLCYNYGSLACNATGPDPCIIPGNCNSCQAGNVLAASCVTQIAPFFNPSVTFITTTYTSTLINPSTVFYSTPVPVSTSCPTPTSSSSTNVGAIAGGVVGGVVAIALALIALFLFCRRKRTAPVAVAAGGMGASHHGHDDMEGDMSQPKYGAASPVVSPHKVQYHVGDGTVPTDDYMSPQSPHATMMMMPARSSTLGSDAMPSSPTSMWDAHRAQPNPVVAIQSLAYPRTPTVAPMSTSSASPTDRDVSSQYQVSVAPPRYH